MQKNLTLIHDLTHEQFVKLIEGLQNQIKDLKENFEPKSPIEYLTRNEVSLILKCDLSTIHNWCKKGKLIPYGIGNRVYFKRSEIEEVLVPFGKNKGADND